MGRTRRPLHKHSLAYFRLNMHLQTTVNSNLSLILQLDNTKNVIIMVFFIGHSCKKLSRCAPVTFFLNIYILACDAFDKQV